MIAAVIALGGCYSFKPLTVDVRDRETEEPVADALVIVRALNLFNPYYPHGEYHPSPAKSVQATTDADGAARFGSGAPCPASVLILRSDLPPQEFSFDVHPGDRGEPGPWFTPEAPTDDHAGAVEVRLRP